MKNKEKEDNARGHKEAVENPLSLVLLTMVCVIDDMYALAWLGSHLGRPITIKGPKMRLNDTKS